MASKKIKRTVVKSNYFRHFFCLVFVCVTILIMGIVVVAKHGALDIYSLMDLVHHLFPNVFFLGLLGWFTGLILDNPKRHMIIDYKDLIYEELIKTNNKISPEELDRKLKIGTKDEESEDEENFPFEDADMNIGESEIEL